MSVASTRHGAFAVLTPDGRVQYGSEGFSDLVGHAHDGPLAGQSIDALFTPPENQADWYCRARIEEGTVSLAATGQEFRYQLEPIHLNQGCIIFIEPAVATQITSMDQLYARAFQLNPGLSAISVLETGEHLDVNDAWLRALEYERDEVIGRTASDMNLWEHGDSTRKEIARLLHEEGKVRNLLARLRTRSGQLRDIVVSAERFDYFGQQLAFFASLDITDIISAENQLAAKSAFLADVSHELRNPLSGILGMVDLLTGSRLTEIQRDQLDTLRGAAKIMLTVLNDLLDLSKIDAGRLDLEQLDFDLTEIVHRTVQLFAPKQDAQSVTISCASRWSGPLVVRGDPTRLHQILFNLVGNAIKFTPKGQVCIELDAQQTATGALTIQLAVRDTGIGMTPEQISRLFSPYHQGDLTISRRFGGTGLGLSIVHKLVGLMQGDIQVESSPGVGSCFTVHLTLPRGQLVARPIAPPSPTFAAPSSQALNVLVADDTEANRALISHYLRRLGHQPILCSNGQEALDQLHQADQLPHLILLDVHMPDIDGLTAARMIRQMPGPVAQLPIIAMTADLSTDRMTGLRAAGLDDVLYKPIDWAKLRSILTACAPPPLTVPSNRQG